MARLNEFSHPKRAPKGQRADKRSEAVAAAYESGLAAWALANGFVCPDGSPLVQTAAQRRLVGRARKEIENL
jgi:hypothetical protein